MSVGKTDLVRKRPRWQGTGSALAPSKLSTERRYWTSNRYLLANKTSEQIGPGLPDLKVRVLALDVTIGPWAYVGRAGCEYSIASNPEQNSINVRFASIKC
jgi:hypothetical protein